MKAKSHRHFLALDSVIALDLDDEALVDGFDSLIATYPAAALDLQPQLGYRVALSPPAIWRDARQCYQPELAIDLPPLFENDLYPAVIERCRQPWLLHASAVARAGRAILLVGPSGAGKSTLALALAARGAQYISDECVALDQTPIDRSGQCRLVVTGLRRPIGLDDPGDPIARDLPRGFARSEYRLRGRDDNIRRSLLVHPPPTRDAGRAIVRVMVSLAHLPGQAQDSRPLSPGQALPLLWESTLRRDHEALRFAAVNLRCCRTMALSTRNVDEACALIEGLWHDP